MAVYSSVSAVKQYTGLIYTDLGLDDEAALDTLIEEWLEEAKSLIDGDRNRDYDADGSVPKGIHNIALRIVGNMASVAVMKRQTPVVMNDDFTNNIATDMIFTDSIKRDLRRFPAKPRFRMSLYKASTYEDDEEA